MKKANLEALLSNALKTASRGATPTPEQASLRDDELALAQGAGTAPSVGQRPIVLRSTVHPLDCYFTNPQPKDPPPHDPPDAGGDFTEAVHPPDGGTPPIYHEAGPPIPWDPNPFPPDPKDWI